MKQVTNTYGQFTDIPVNEAWFLKFDILFLPTDHRKILNRQPLFAGKICICFDVLTAIVVLRIEQCFPKDNTMIRFNDWIWNNKVMSN
jgi:hypothetical protein